MSVNIDRENKFVRLDEGSRPSVSQSQAVINDQSDQIISARMIEGGETINADVVNLLQALSKADADLGDPTSDIVKSNKSHYGNLLQREKYYFDLAAEMLDPSEGKYTDDQKTALMELRKEYDFSVHGVLRLAKLLRAQHAKNVAEHTIDRALQAVPRALPIHQGISSRTSAFK